jgi:hypothetical protein
MKISGAKFSSNQQPSGKSGESGVQRYCQGAASLSSLFSSARPGIFASFALFAVKIHRKTHKTHKKGTLGQDCKLIHGQRKLKSFPQTCLSAYGPGA